MYYEDQARRFNLLSGFLVGALLGTVLTLLMGSRSARRQSSPPRLAATLGRLRTPPPRTGGAAGRVLRSLTAFAGR
jgi:hypothetical protein